jgi:hypothetical protein
MAGPWEGFGPFVVIAILYSASKRRAGVPTATSYRFFWDLFLFFGVQRVLSAQPKSSPADRLPGDCLKNSRLVLVLV